MERAMGIEPTSEAWEASILPLNYARSGTNRHQDSTGFEQPQEGRLTPSAIAA
jgi:hypothetical protein